MAPTEPQEGRREVVLGTTAEPTTLDPAFVTTTSARQISALVHRGLVRFDPRGRVAPELARTVPQPIATATGARVEWELRPRFWEDGQPVTAADLRFAWALERRPDLELVNARDARDVEAIMVLSPHRFVAEWSAPRPSMVAPGTHTVLPAHDYPQPPPSGPFEGRGKRPLSNGPYRLESWRSGVEAVFEPNPHWTGPGPRLDRVRVRFYSSEDALFLALLRGEVDAVGEAAGLSGPKARLAGEELADTHVVHRTDGGLWVHLLMDLDHPLTGDPAFRQLVAVTVDRSALAEVFGAGAATPAWGMFPRNHPAWGPRDPIPPPNAAERARVRARIDAHPTLDLHIASEGGRSADVATVIAESLEAIGVAVRIRPTPFDVLNERLERGHWSGMALYGWRIRPDWDVHSILHRTGRQNFNGFSRPEVDAALEAARETLDREAWARHLRAAESRYLEHLPSVPLLHGQAISIRPRWLRGWQPTGTTTPVTWNAERWTGAPGASAVSGN